MKRYPFSPSKANSPSRNGKRRRRAVAKLMSKLPCAFLSDEIQADLEAYLAEGVGDRTKESFIEDKGGLLLSLMKNEKVVLGHLGFEQDDWDEIHRRLVDFNEREPLLVSTFERGGHSSGTNSQRTFALLQMFDAELVKDGKDAFFTKIIKAMQKCFTIKHGWLLANESGVHPEHQDGDYKGTHRIIFNFGCIDKTMTFRRGTETVTFTIPHMSFVVLSMEGGGVIGNICHGVSADSPSWIFVLEVTMKNA